jgi:tRNA uridine 5-carbamoylmethylation protein Kti12
MKKMYIMRGLPGSGKSTWARTAARLCLEDKATNGVVICSTDDQFLNDKGEYVFEPHKLGWAHAENQRKVYAFLKAGVSLIIVDNTNTTRKEMEPYQAMAQAHGYEVEQVLIGKDQLFPGMDGSQYSLADYIDLCARRNTHKVPRESIERMARRFQE